MSRLVTFLIVMFTLAPEAARAQWAPMPWQVRCLPDSGLDADDCAPDDGGSVVSIIRQDLTVVTAWLRDRGFPQPKVERGDGGDYLAWAGADTLRSSSGAHVAGYYEPDEERMVVEAFHFIQLGGAKDETGTAAHELFHAVQAVYPGFWELGDEGDWVIEGTAQAFEAAWLTRDGASPLAPGGHAYVYGHRLYSVPIYEKALDNQEYATSHFWLALGEMIGSEHRIEFVRDVLEHSAEAPGALLDAVLTPYHPDGFAHYFPRLVGRYAMDPDHFEAARARVRVKDGYDETLTEAIRPLTGHYYIIRPDESVSEPLQVEVERRMDTGIHFVFDGIVDEEVGVDASDPIYRTTLSPGDSLVVQIVNVAPEAAATTDAEYSFTVRAEAYDSCHQPPGASFTLNVTGPREGTGEGSFAFDRQVARARGREIVNYTGLTVLDYGVRKMVLWEGTQTMGIQDQLALARQRLNMPDASDEDVGIAMQNLPIQELLRLFPEFQEDGEMDGVGIPDGFSLSNSTREGDGTHTIMFKKGASQFSIMLPLSGHFGTGRVQSPMLNIGVQAPAFLGGGVEGIVLANPEVTFSALEPGLCVAGTFSGVYEGPVGQANPVTGTFRVIIPEDALVVSLD